MPTYRERQLKRLLELEKAEAAKVEEAMQALIVSSTQAAAKLVEATAECQRLTAENAALRVELEAALKRRSRKAEPLAEVEGSA